MQPIESLKYSLDVRRPNETAESLLDIDFAEQAALGRTTLFVDAESTFVHFDGTDVPDEMRQKFVQAREDGIKNVVIITNKNPKTEDELWQLFNWTEQIGADLTIVPRERQHRKGSPYMIMQAMQHLEADPDHCVMVGDKLSDVIAANNARVASIKVDRYGWADHPGDRLGRRAMDRALMISGLVTVSVEPIVLSQFKPTVIKETDEQGTHTIKEYFDIPEFFYDYGKIVGYGGPVIELTGENKAMLPPPRGVATRAKVARLKKAVGTEKLDEYLYENGGKVADQITKWRMRTGLASAALYGAGVYFDKKWLRRVGAIGSALSQAADALDGAAARRDKRGLDTPERIKGANDDRFNDKVVAGANTGVLFISGRMPVLDAGVQSGREVAQVKRLLPRYKNAGYDTKATLGSKAATGLQTAALLAAMTELPKLKVNRLHHAATIAKVLSYHTQKRAFEHRKAKKELARDLRLIHGVPEPVKKTYETAGSAA